MSNADKLKSIYFYERVIANANDDIDRLQADIRRIDEDIKVRTAERDEAFLTLSAVKEAIHRVKDPLRRELLERYYLQGQTWEQVAEKMHYSPARIYELRRQAIDEIDLDFLPDIEQCAYFKSNRNENY
ncbi:MAG: DUF1492 domain-containing protein [Oscillospiraceae bacterium]|nr:DUF1492 domain-containing protein [Oscillospiraceae bacterium]